VSSRTWKLRIQDILDAIASIQSRIVGMSLESLAADETVAKAVLYDFIVIGEASANVPAELQSRYSNIPWRLMQDMRNVMAHEYFQINIERVWKTIEDDLQSLVPLLHQLLEQEKPH